MISVNMRKRIYAKYEDSCAYCKRMQELEIHHIIPKGHGGRHGEAKKKSELEENLILLCKVCHDASHGIKTFYNDFSCQICPVGWACQFNQSERKSPFVAHVTAYNGRIDYEDIAERSLQIYYVVKEPLECNQEPKL